MRLLILGATGQIGSGVLAAAPTGRVEVGRRLRAFRVTSGDVGAAMVSLAEGSE